jgi:hypothetical protein
VLHVCVPSVAASGRNSVVLWNPRLWWKYEFSLSLPEESLPVVRQTAKRTAQKELILWPLTHGLCPVRAHKPVRRSMASG